MRRLVADRDRVAVDSRRGVLGVQNLAAGCGVVVGGGHLDFFGHVVGVVEVPGRWNAQCASFSSGRFQYSTGRHHSSDQSTWSSRLAPAPGALDVFNTMVIFAVIYVVQGSRYGPTDEIRNYATREMAHSLIV